MTGTAPDAAQHVLSLLATAGTRQDVADPVVSPFSDPAYAWSVPSSPEEVARIIDGAERRAYDRA